MRQCILTTLDVSLEHVLAARVNGTGQCQKLDWSDSLPCVGALSSSPRTFKPCFAIFSRSLSRPSINASGRGGQPGT
jgi:hypothetical protein